MTASSGDGAVLQLAGVHKRFGGLVAIEALDLSVGPREVVGLIGPNGSGKTTALNVANGIYKPDKGAVVLQGVNVTGYPPAKMAARGLSRSFQAPRVFKSLSVMDNMLLPLTDVTVGEKQRSHIGSLLELVGLHEVEAQSASELSGGQQKLLEFARALVTHPAVVLLDEPFAGVHPVLKRTMYDSIEWALTHHGASFLIVSHEIPELLSLADRVICLGEGRLLAEGSPESVRHDEAVVEAYLGTMK